MFIFNINISIKNQILYALGSKYYLISIYIIRMSKTKTKTKGRKKCPKGMIEKSGYSRRSYNRKGYLRESTGTYVKPSKVKKSQVGSTCIKDRGRPGKGPYTLPKPDEKIHLSKFGWSYRKPSNQRHKALREAAKAADILSVYRRMNLLRNYQANPKAKEVMSQDVNYLKSLYAKHRSRFGRSRRSFKLRQKEKKEHEMEGGADTDAYDDAVADEFRRRQLEKLRMPVGDLTALNDKGAEVTEWVNEEKMVGNKPTGLDFYSEGAKSNMAGGNSDLNQYFTAKVLCINGKCQLIENFNIIREENGVALQIYSLNPDDFGNVMEMDIEKKLNENVVKSALKNNTGNLIGFKVDDIFEGYIAYDRNDGQTAKITWCACYEDYANVFYKCIEDYLKTHGFIEIRVCVNKNSRFFKRKEQFWLDHGFRPVGSTSNYIYFSKEIVPNR